jgi:hypothetical protein
MMTPAAKTKSHETPKQPEVAPAPATTPTTEAPTAPAAVATPPAAVATTLGASKSEMTLAKLREAWTTKNIDLSKLRVQVDGKFLNVQVDETWPLIVIGPGGGINIPEVKSYPKAWDAALDAKALLEKQNGRTAKAATPATPTVVTVKATVVPDQPKAADAPTPAQRKKQADAQLEAKLQQQA